MRDQTTKEIQKHLERRLRESFRLENRKRNKSYAIRSINTRWALSYVIESAAREGNLVTDPDGSDRVFSCQLVTEVYMFDPQHPERGYGYTAFQSGGKHRPSKASTSELMRLVDTDLCAAMQDAVEDYEKSWSQDHYSGDRPRRLSPAKPVTYENTKGSVDTWDYKEIDRLAREASLRLIKKLGTKTIYPFDSQRTVIDHLVKAAVYHDHFRFASVEVPEPELRDFNGRGPLIRKLIHEQGSHGFFYVRAKMLTKRGDRTSRHPQSFRLPIPLFSPSYVTEEHILDNHAEPFIIELAKFINAPNLPTGLWPTICLDGVIGHECLWGHLISAAYRVGDESAALPSIGDDVSQIPFDIYDDPTLTDHFMGSYKYDAEGERGKKTQVVRGGKIHRFLTDRATAGFLGVPNTGHSRVQHYFSVDEEANYLNNDLPEAQVGEVRMSNAIMTCLEPTSLEEMREQAKKMAAERGLPHYIELPYVSVNGGDAEVGSGSVTGHDVLAYAVNIKTGRKRPVRGVRIQGDAQQILKSFVAAGETSTPRHGQCISSSGTIPITEASTSLLSEGLPFQRVVSEDSDESEMRRGKCRRNRSKRFYRRL